MLQKEVLSHRVQSLLLPHVCGNRIFPRCHYQTVASLSGHAHPFLGHQLEQKRRDPVRPAVSENKRTLGNGAMGLV